MFNFTCRFFDYIIYDSNNNAKTQYYTECIRNDIRIRPIYKTHAEHGYWNDIVNEKQWLEKTSTRDAIKCDSTSWRGEGTWNYLPSNPSPRGRNLPPRVHPIQSNHNCYHQIQILWHLTTDTLKQIDLVSIIQNKFSEFLLIAMWKIWLMGEYPTFCWVRKLLCHCDETKLIHT